MKWSLEYLEQDEIVSATTSGTFKINDIHQLTKEILAFGAERNAYKYLVDDSQIDLQISTLEIDDLPSIFKKFGLTEQDKFALVYKPSLGKENNYNFFKSTSGIQGLQVKVFTDIEQAKQWLCSASKVLR